MPYRFSLILGLACILLSCDAPAPVFTGTFAARTTSTLTCPGFDPYTVEGRLDGFSLAHSGQTVTITQQLANFRFDPYSDYGLGLPCGTATVVGNNAQLTPGKCPALKFDISGTTDTYTVEIQSGTLTSDGTILSWNARATLTDEYSDGTSNTCVVTQTGTTAGVPTNAK